MHTTLTASGVAFTIILALAACTTLQATSTEHATTTPHAPFILAPNEAYDALCMVNLQGGDPFYVSRGYDEEYAFFHDKLSDGDRAAVARIIARLKRDGDVVPAKLALVFSAVDVQTLDDLLAVVRDDARFAALAAAYAATPFGKDGGFAGVADERADLATALGALARVGFHDHWRTTALPRVERFIGDNAPRVARYEIVAEDERVLGRSLGVTSVTAYVLAYVKPHGIRITGWRFLTDIDYPVDVTVKTALHELLHPPFLSTSPAAPTVARWERDPFLLRLAANHDPSFGYTTPSGLVEEDLATAVDVYNAHRLGLLPDVAGYFRGHDDGIHVLALLLYERLASADWSHYTTYDALLIDLERTRALAPGDLEERFAASPLRYDVAALATSTTPR